VRSLGTFSWSFAADEIGAYDPICAPQQAFQLTDMQRRFRDYLYVRDAQTLGSAGPNFGTGAMKAASLFVLTITATTGIRLE